MNFLLYGMKEKHMSELRTNKECLKNVDIELYKERDKHNKK
jgi:hypothetical protein